MKSKVHFALFKGIFRTPFIWTLSPGFQRTFWGALHDEEFFVVESSGVAGTPGVRLPGVLPHFAELISNGCCQRYHCERTRQKQPQQPQLQQHTQHTTTYTTHTQHTHNTHTTHTHNTHTTPTRQHSTQHTTQHTTPTQHPHNIHTTQHTTHNTQHHTTTLHNTTQCSSDTLQHERGMTPWQKKVPLKIG